MPVASKEIASKASKAPVATSSSRGRQAKYDNRITLQKLEVFCSVIEFGGISRAAEHLWVAQPVVSAHVQSLQERLGVKLLYRDGQRMRLTDAGEHVYQWAMGTLSGTRELMRELDGLTDGARGSVTVAASMSVGSYLLPPLLARFRAERPRAEIALRVSDPEHALIAVEAGECDLGLIMADDSWHGHPSICFEAVGEEPVALVAAPDYQPGLTSLRLEALGQLPLISSPRDNVRRELVDRQLAERGVFPQNTVMELGHPEAMKRVARAGLGVCLLFRCSVAEDLEQGQLREIAIEDATLSVPVISIVREDKKLTPIQTHLLEELARSLAPGAVV